jgi:glycosyltransferase involved in cell wall biosynthesis
LPISCKIVNMRILHIHDFFAPGNSRLGYDMCRFLAQAGHRIDILAGVGELGPRDGETRDGITFHTYPYGFGLSTLEFVRYALNKNKIMFDELQGKYKFDLLLFNQPLCFYGVTRSKMSKDIPKIYSFISPWAVEWQIENPYKVRWYKKINAIPRNMLENYALEKSDRIMTISKFVYQEIIKYHPNTNHSKISIIPCGVDTSFFTPKDYLREEERRNFGIDKDDKVISTVRRLVQRMGIDNLTLAMQIVLEKIPRALLLIGGEGPLKTKLQILSKKFSYTDRIRFLGYIEDAKLPSLYRASDLVVLPTKELEGFGLVSIESMACGTPVMGTPVGAIPEVVGGFSKQMLFCDITPKAQAEGIIRFFKELNSNEIRKNCREYVVSNFDWNKLIKKIEQLFQEVVKK